MRKILITGLENSGVWVDEDDGVAKIAQDYFQDLFNNTRTDSSENIPHGEWESSLMNEHLAHKPFTDNEIKEAVFHMDPHKKFQYFYLVGVLTTIQL